MIKENPRSRREEARQKRRRFVFILRCYYVTLVDAGKKEKEINVRVRWECV
jgi:hypothetical protein